MKVTEVMSRPVITVRECATVKDAARLLIDHSISALPVVDEAGVLVGIVSEADLVPIETRPDPRSQATPIPPTAGTTPHLVSEVMTRDVITVPDDAEVSLAARTMVEAAVKRVPVIRGSRLVGIVSRRDLVRVIARSDDDVRTQLQRRLHEAGLTVSRREVDVAGGVVTIGIDAEAKAKRLAESVALSVPGVLEVRFVR